MASDACLASPRLPLELFQRIIELLPGATLKNVRLTNRTLAGLSEPLLFNFMVLIPQLQFLDDFYRIFSNSPQTRFIKGLIYDDRWLPTVEAHYKKLKSMKITDQAIDQQRRHALEALQSFKTSYLGAVDWPENSLLIRIFQITAAQSIQVIEEQIDGKDPPKLYIPSYIQRLCIGHPSIQDIQPVGTLRNSYTSTQARFHKVLTAIWGARREFKSIKVTNLFWYNFLGSGPSPAIATVFPSALENLSTLDIQWHCKKRHSWLNLTYLDRIHQVLRLAKNVANVRLCLHTRPLAEAEVAISYEDSQLSPLLGISDGYCFEHLKKLILESIAFFQQEFFDFLEANETIESMGLRNIVLMRESSDRPRGCFVEVLRRLRNHRLRDVGFGGYLSNGGNQLWYPNQKVPHKSTDQPNRPLHWRTRSYVLNLSKTLPPELIRHEVVQSYNDVPPPTAENPWTKGDCTWSITLRTSPPADQAFFEDQDEEDIVPLPSVAAPGFHDDAATFVWTDIPPPNSNSASWTTLLNLPAMAQSQHSSQLGNNEHAHTDSHDASNKHTGGKSTQDHKSGQGSHSMGPMNSWVNPAMGSQVQMNPASTSGLNAEFDFDKFLNSSHAQDPFSESTTANKGVPIVEDEYIDHGPMEDEIDEDWEDEIDDGDEIADGDEDDDASHSDVSSSSSGIEDSEHCLKQNGDVETYGADDVPLNGDISLTEIDHSQVKDTNSTVQEELGQEALKNSHNPVNGDVMEG